MLLGDICRVALREVRRHLGHPWLERVPASDPRLSVNKEVVFCLAHGASDEQSVVLINAAAEALGRELRECRLIGTLPFEVEGDYVIGELVKSPGGPVPGGLCLRGREQRANGDRQIHLQVLAG